MIFHLKKIGGGWAGYVSNSGNIFITNSYSRTKVGGHSNIGGKKIFNFFEFAMKKKELLPLKLKKKMT